MSSPCWGTFSKLEVTLLGFSNQLEGGRGLGEGERQYLKVSFWREENTYYSVLGERRDVQQREEGL